MPLKSALCARPRRRRSGSAAHSAPTVTTSALTPSIVQPLAVEQAHRDRGAADEQRREPEQRCRFAARPVRIGPTARPTPVRRATARCRHSRDTPTIRRGSVLASRTPKRRQRDDGERPHAAVQRVDDRRLKMAQPEEVAGPRQRRGDVHHQHGAAVAAQLFECAAVANERDRGEQDGRGQERQQDDRRRNRRPERRGRNRRRETPATRRTPARAPDRDRNATALPLFPPLRGTWRRTPGRDTRFPHPVSANRGDATA